MSGGIYQITNQVNGKRYIGSSINPSKRWRNHLSDLRRGQHCNQYLQRAYDKHGEAAFVFAVLEHIARQNLIEREQHYLDMLEPEYNNNSIAGKPPNRTGAYCSEETRRRMSEAQKGKCLSKEHRRKISEALTGRPNPHRGHPQSEGTKQKISEALMGHAVAEDTRRKISEAHRGKYPSKETRRKISKAGKGRHHSAKTRAKMSVARRAYWRRIHAIENP